MYVKTNRYDRFDSIEIKESLFKEFDLPNHFHDVYCIGLLSGGIKTSIIEGSSFLIHSNTVSIVNPYQIHSDKNYDADASHFRMIYVNKEVVNYFAKKLTGKKDNCNLFTNDLITDSSVSSAILKFFEQMNDETLLEGKLMGLVEILINKYRRDDFTENERLNLNALTESVEHARLNFSDKIDIGKMALSCKLSKFQFIRHFKKLTGLTPASYIIVSRINYAKSMIINNIPIGQVALESGFYDHSQFCKYFKYYTNLSPIEYKRNCNIVQA